MKEILIKIKENCRYKHKFKENYEMTYKDIEVGGIWVFDDGNYEVVILEEDGKKYFHKLEVSFDFEEKK